MHTDQHPPPAPTLCRVCEEELTLVQQEHSICWSLGPVPILHPLSHSYAHQGTN